MRKIGILGGSFDPIHNGHLSIASQVLENLALDEVRFIPCHIPAHKAAYKTSTEDRLKMLEMALINKPKFWIDKRELEKNSVSYSFETLISIREEIKEHDNLIFILGWDSWQDIETWDNWQLLFELSNFAVVKRPGAMAQEKQANSFLKTRLIEEHQLTKRPFGYYSIVSTTEIDVSSTWIKKTIANRLSKNESGKKNIAKLQKEEAKEQDVLTQFLPDSVWQYIRNNNLYID